VDLVVNNKDLTLKLLKKIHNLHPKLCKLNLVDTMGGSSTKNKKEFGGCQFNEV
jgi:hypothetical protein